MLWTFVIRSWRREKYLVEYSEFDNYLTMFILLVLKQSAVSRERKYYIVIDQSALNF